MHRIACRLFQRVGYLPIYVTHVERSMVVEESIGVFQELHLLCVDTPLVYTLEAQPGDSYNKSV